MAFEAVQIGFAQGFDLVVMMPREPSPMADDVQPQRGAQVGIRPLGKGLQFLKRLWIPSLPREILGPRTCQCCALRHAVFPVPPKCPNNLSVVLSRLRKPDRHYHWLVLITIDIKRTNVLCYGPIDVFVFNPGECFAHMPVCRAPFAHAISLKQLGVFKRFVNRFDKRLVYDADDRVCRRRGCRP